MRGYRAQRIPRLFAAGVVLLGSLGLLTRAPAPAMGSGLQGTYTLEGPVSVLWDVLSETHRFEGATAVAVSSGGATVFVTGSYWANDENRGDPDYDTVAYDAATGAQLWESRYNGPNNADDRAVAAAVSPDGATVFVTGTSKSVADPGWDHVTLAYSAATGAQVWEARYENGTQGPNQGLSPEKVLAVSPDGATVFITGVGGLTTVAYNAASGAQRWQAQVNDAYITSPGKAIAVSPDGGAVFVTGSGSCISTVALNAANGALLWTELPTIPVAHYCGEDFGGAFVAAIVASPGGAIVFVVGSVLGGGPDPDYDYVTLAYSAATGAQLWESRYDGPINWHDQAIDAAVSPDGANVFVTGSSAGFWVNSFNWKSDCATVAYDAATGTQRWEARYIDTALGLSSAMAVSPDGRAVLVTGITRGGPVDAFATVAYSTATGKQLWETHSNWETNTALAVSPDGATVFVTGTALYYDYPVGYSNYATVAFTTGPNRAVRGPVQRLDAWPEFVGSTGNTVTAAEVLAVGGGPRRGVAADGQATVLLRLPATADGTVAFAVQNEANTNEGGGLYFANRSDPRLALTVPVVNTSRGKFAFAYYRAPADFVRMSAPGDAFRATRSVVLHATFYPAGGSAQTLPDTSIEIHRPPVVLLHGVWSNADTWSQGQAPFFTSFIQDSRFVMWIADYDGDSDNDPSTRGSALSFAANALVPRTAVAQAIALFKLRRPGVAVMGADIVGHSMGGVLTRVYFNQPEYRRRDNLMQGDVHKLITLDTPHFGSGLALALVDMRDNHLLCGEYLTWLMAQAGLPIDQGAVNDLVPGNRAILDMGATGIPTHALIGHAGFGCEALFCLSIDARVFFSFAIKTWSLCAAGGVDTACGVWDTVFSGASSDGIVSAYSQRGGLPSGAYDVFQGCDFNHPANTTSPVYRDRVLALLNTPSYTATFAFPPAPSALSRLSAAPRAVSGTSRLRPSSHGQLHITAPLGGTQVESGSSVSVTVVADNGIAPQSLVVLGVDDTVVLDPAGSSPWTVSYQVSANASGPITISAAGQLADGSLVTSPAVTVTAMPNAILADLVVQPDAIRFANMGESQPLQVTGLFNDQLWRDLTDTTTGTSFATSDPTVATVTSDGLVTAVDSGEALITVSNGFGRDSALQREVFVAVGGNRQPIADAGPDVTTVVGCQATAGTILLDGTRSSDFDSLPHTNDNIAFFEWDFGNDGTVDEQGERKVIELPLGVTTVRLRVTDWGGLTSEDTVSYAVKQTADSFSDVPCGYWAFQFIEAVSRAAIASGFPDGSFHPDSMVSRSAMAVFMARAANLTLGDFASFAPPACASETFSDLSCTHPSYKFIEYIVSKGIAAGFPDGTYKPGNFVSRGAMAVFLARVRDLADLDLAAFTPPACGSERFSDVSCAHPSYKFIEYIVSKGITAGFPDGTYKPANIVTRAQMAVFITRAAQLPL